MEHAFTKTIKDILDTHFGVNAESIFRESDILNYLNIKTKSANRGSKSRGSFANIYAIYVLVEDYIAREYHENEGYSNAEGAAFISLLKRQRELPFGEKLQNHALNHRLNEEFKKYFPNSEHIPIVRIGKKYWFNEHLLKVQISDLQVNIAEALIDIINSYIEAKRDAFEQFIEFCERVSQLSSREAIEFITGLLEPTVDARIFEIVSYSILKYYYNNQHIFWGWELENITQENLKLYKTGRTNANDGGIDFVMKPLGRFFQVTETVDVNKYFLDIDKIEKFPITFVVKSTESSEILKQKIKQQAEKQYAIKVVVDKYMSCIEEIINVPMLLERFYKVIEDGHLSSTLDEIIRQSKVEFNYEDGGEISDEIIEDIAVLEAEADNIEFID